MSATNNFNNYRKAKTLFLILFVFTLFHQRVSGSHIVGSDVSYQCTGTPGVYSVNFKLYRDCGGIQLCPNCPSGLSPSCAQSLNIVGAGGSCNGSNFGTQNVSVVTAVSGFDVVQLCVAATSICSNCGQRTPGSFSPGIEVYTFTGTIDLNGLPPSCCLVSVGWSSCCRNAAITTLANPSGLSFYTEAIINRCATPCNSSPTFTNDPVAVTCAGQDFTYNLGAIDPDGDSLSYAFGQSLTGPGSGAPYVSPYSPSVPLPYLGAPIQSPPALPPVGINIDPVTGDLRFRPQGAFVSNLIIEVKQWKTIGGVPTLMGVTRRDIQFYSQVCPNNNPPVLRTYDENAVLTVPQPNFAYSVCAGQQLCFFISAWDNTAAWDTTDMTWNAPSNLTSNGATFVKAYNPSLRTTVGPRLDSMRFCWTPPASMAQNLPYYFVVTAKDRACPIPARVTRSFSIIVRRIPLATIIKTNRNCGYYDFSYSLQNAVSLNNSYTQFQVETSPKSGTYTIYNSSSVSMHRFTQGGTYRIKLRLTTIAPPAPNGCPNDNIIDSVTVPNPVDVSIRDTSNCFGVPVTIQAHGSWGVPFGLGYRYTYYSGGLASTTLIRGLNPDSNVTINPAIAGATTNYKVVVTDLNGCTDSAAFTILTHTLPPHEMVPSMRLCFGTSDTLDAGNNSGAVGIWRWKKFPASPVLADTVSQKIIPGDSGRYVVKKIDNFGCINYDTAMVYVNPQVPVSAGPDRTMCFNDPPLNITATGTTAAIDSFQWRQIPISDPTLVLANTATLVIGPAVNTSYQVKGFITYGGITCNYVDTMNVVVKALPAIIRPSNISLCRNTPLVLMPSITSTNKPGQITSVWTYPQNPLAMNGNQVVTANLNNQPAAPPASPAGNIIRLTVSDVDGCRITDSLVVSLFPVPVINAGPRRKFCDYASTFNITPGTQLYTPNGGALASNEQWYGNGIFKPNALQNYYAFNPQASDVKTDTNIITYVFTATFPLINNVVFNPAVTGFTAPSPSGGCLAQDTVIFDVIKTPKLETGLANPLCKSGDSVNLDNYMLGRSTTAVNPLTSYWYIGAPDQIYRPAITRGRVFYPRNPIIESYTKQYVLVYADTSTTCRVADTTTIQVNENPTVSIGFITASDSAVCTTKGQVFFAMEPAGAAPDTGTTLTSVPVLSSLPNAFNVTTGRFDLSGVPDGVYNVKYHYTDPATNCDNRANTNIRVQGPPQLAISPDQTVCDYDPDYTLTCTTAPKAPYSVKWTTLDGNGILVDNNVLGMKYTASAADKSRGKVSFQAQVIDTSVCNSIIKQTTYTINPKPLADFTVAPATGCVDDRFGVVLKPVYTSLPTGTQNPSYYWYNNTVGNALNTDPANDANFTQTFTQPGKTNVYLVVIASGCKDTAVMPVEAYATPIASFTTNPESTTIAKPYFDFINGSSLADPSGTMNYIWTMPSDKVGNPDRNFYDKDLTKVVFVADTAKIPVWLKVVSDHGCIDSTMRYVRIEPDITVFIPNVFRPIGGFADCPHGCNQTFKVAATGYQSIEIYVFNRWGQMVYKSNDANDNGWDGRDMQSKQDCQQDAYIYQINATSFNNKKYTYSGSVTLLR